MNKFTYNLDNSESPVSESPNNKWTIGVVIFIGVLAVAIIVGIVTLASMTL